MNIYKSAGYTITTQAELRRAFWSENKGLQRRRTIRMGDAMVHPTDTRVAFVDWVDYMVRNGLIPARLAQTATL